MDVMMKMTTDDVRRLRAQFATNLSLEAFVGLMRTSLQDRITNELEFVVGAIELFHTIDVNGDQTLEWDEFAGYLLDAGQATAAAASAALSATKNDGEDGVDDPGDEDDEGGEKRFMPWRLAFRDPKTPMNRLKAGLRQLVHLPDLGALAYVEDGADVVYVYALHFDDNEAPRHLATIRLHTAFQEHEVLELAYVPDRRWLVVSSVRAAAYLSVWQLPDYRAATATATTPHAPVLLHRAELGALQERLTWLPGPQLLATAAVVYPALSRDGRVPVGVRQQGGKGPSTTAPTKHHQLVLWDLSTMTNVDDLARPHERLKGVSAMVTYATPNHRVYVALGRDDGVLVVLDLDARRELQSLDAHDHGVRELVSSDAFGCLASIGRSAYADETSHHIVIWKIASSGRLQVLTTLRDHTAPVVRVLFADSTRHLLSCDVHGTFRIHAARAVRDDTPPFPCLQVFTSTGLGAPPPPLVFIPPTARSDAVLIVGQPSRVGFFDLCVHRPREDMLFVHYSRALNVIIGATPTRVHLWRAESGRRCSTFEYAALVRASANALGKGETNATSDSGGSSGSPSMTTTTTATTMLTAPPVITAVCVDDRERKLLLGDDRGAIRVVNAVNGNVMKTLDPHAAAVTWLAYVLRSKRVLSLGADSVLHICDENNPLGFYVPFGGGRPQSVVLESLRFRPPPAPTAAAAATATGAFEIVRALGNEELNLVAVLVAGPHGESFVQLWNFDLSHAQGTCVVPPDGDEITCMAFVGLTTELVGGTATGRVVVWVHDPDHAAYRCTIELTFQTDTRAGANEIARPPPAITHVAAIAGARRSSSSTGSSSDTTFVTEGAPGPEAPDEDEVDGVFVVAADEIGRVAVWHVPSATLARHRDPSGHRTARQARRRIVDETAGAATAASALFQHEGMVLGYEALAALYAHSGRDRVCPSALGDRLEPVVAWAAHDGAVSWLHLVEDPPVLLTSAATGEIRVWARDGAPLGLLDHFATRRAPVTQPWAFPVDMEERRRQRRDQAQSFLDRWRRDRAAAARTGRTPHHRDADDHQRHRGLDPEPHNHQQQQHLHHHERLSILQQRLALSPEEMATERESLRRDSALAAALGSPAHRRRQHAVLLDPHEADRAVRRHLLAQAAPPRSSSISSPMARAQSLPAGLAHQRESSLHAVLQEVNQLQQPPGSDVPSTASGARRRRYSMVTIADLKHALRPRTSSSAVHCDLPTTGGCGSVAGATNTLTRSRGGRSGGPAQASAVEVIVTTGTVGADRRLDFADLCGHEHESNQLEPTAHTSTSRDQKKPHGVLNYHMKLAHSWRHYQL